MKIGFVIYGTLDTISGGYLYDRMLVDYLRLHGDEVEIISLPWRNYFSHLLDNFHFRLPDRFDILIQDELNHPSLIAANWRGYSYPIISLVHHLRCSELRPNWQNIYYQSIEKKYLQSVDGFIFNSNTTRSVVQELIGSEKPFIVSFPPTDRFGQSISKEKIAERTKQKVLQILFLGNVTYRKGLHTLLKAIKGLSSVELNVVGGMGIESRYANQIIKFVNENNLSSRVKFHGPLDNEDLMEILARSNVLAVPSSYEGFGIVYLEGMGFGLPAIGTTAGAANEIITHGKNGYLIEPENDAHLSELLGGLVDNRNLLLELSLNAMKRHQTQPSWEETAKGIKFFLENLIK